MRRHPRVPVKGFHRIHALGSEHAIEHGRHNGEVLQIEEPVPLREGGSLDGHHDSV